MAYIPFQEKSNTAHMYLFVAIFLLLLWILTFIFIIDRREWIELNTDLSSEVSKDLIDKITHDDDVWYLTLGDEFPRSTCVGYGNYKDSCPKWQNFCAGGETYGDPAEQMAAVNIAANSPGGIHPGCPLLYSGL